MRTLLLAGLLAFLTTGCLWARGHINQPDFYERAASIENGVSTEDDVLDALGSYPGTVRELKSGKTLWAYIFGDSKTEGFNMFIVNFQKSNIGIDTALFKFDENGVLEKHWISQNSENLEWETWPFGDE